MKRRRFNLFWISGLIFLCFLSCKFSFASETTLEEWVSEGNSYYLKGEMRKALEAYQKALPMAADPAKAKIHFNLGNTHYRLGELENALTEYQEALRLNPKDEDAKYNLEVVLRSLRGERLALRGMPAEVQGNQQDLLDEEVKLLLERLEQDEFRDPKGVPTPHPPPGKGKEYKKDW